MGTDRGCGSCHAKDQPHKLVRKDLLACERCHGESVWKPAKPTMQFNHDDRKDAAMPLLGQHKDVACTKCHAKNVYKLPFARPDSCGNAGCHQSPHDGHLFGVRPCEWCHSPTFKDLKNIQVFDHTERTRFDLGPAHRKIKCEQCHTKSLGEVKPNRACEQCHAKDSHHGDRFKEFGSPPRCETCHPSGGPKFTPNNFNHGAHTKFKLEFKHAEQTCRACHRGSSPSDFERFTLNPNKDCKSCHAHAKVHSDEEHPDGKYKSSQCLQCHRNGGNPGQKDKSPLLAEVHGPNGRFPLIKRHKDVACASCHTGRDSKGKTSFSELKPNCNAAGQCHEDSLHKGTLGEKCMTCHVSGIWDALKFDHDKPFPKDAKGKVDAFPLKGEHKKNKCEACHPQRKFAEAPTTCAAEGCHKEDDAHKRPARRQVRAVPRRDRRQHLQPQHDVGVQARRQAPDRAVLRLPPVGDVQAAADRLLRLPPRAGRPQGPVRHRLRAVPHHPDVGRRQAAARRRRLLAQGHARQHRVRALPPRQPAARRQRQPVHQLPPPGRHPQQLAVAALRRVPHPVVVRAGAVRSRPGGLQPHRPAPHDRVLRLPQERQLRRAVAAVRGCHHDDARKTAVGTDGAAPPAGTINTHFTTLTCASCHSANTWLGAPGVAVGRESVCR